MVVLTKDCNWEDSFIFKKKSTEKLDGGKKSFSLTCIKEIQ